MLCDASVLVPLVVPERTSGTMLSMLSQHDRRPSVSDFAFGEVCSAMAIRVRRREITPGEAERILLVLEDWTGRGAERVATQSGDIEQASRYVRRFELGLRLPDAVHLAIARRLSLPVATQDRRQAAAATALGVHVIKPVGS